MKEAVFIVLILDASGSVSEDEWRMQLQGYRVAMENAHIIALTEEYDVSFAMLQFSDTPEMITDFTDREGVLATLPTVERMRDGDTCINKALLMARDLVYDEPGRRVIDLATDGMHTVESCGRPLPQRLGYAFFDDSITINGLQLPYGTGADGEKVYQSLMDIATGFVVPTTEWEDVTDATTRKLYSEISLDAWPREREAHRPVPVAAEARADFDMRDVWRAEDLAVRD